MPIKPGHRRLCYPGGQARDLPASTWKWRCCTVCPASSPQLFTIRYPLLNPNSLAIREMTTKIFATMTLFSGRNSAAEAMCFFGYHQKVYWGLRINIVKCQQIFIFIDFFRGNLPRRDFTKKAVHFSASFLKQPELFQKKMDKTEPENKNPIILAFFP